MPNARKRGSKVRNWVMELYVILIERTGIRDNKRHNPRDPKVGNVDCEALRFQHPPVLVTQHSSGDVHDNVAQGKERPRRKRLGEEVGKVVRAAHERNRQLELFDFFPDEKMTSMDVFGTRVMLGIGCVVVGLAELAQQRAEVGGFLGGLRSGDDFCFAGRQRYCRLLFAAPSDRCFAVHEDVARCGMTRSPVGVGESCQRLCIGACVPEAYSPVVRQVAQYPLGGGHHIGCWTNQRTAKHAHRVCDVRARLRRAVQ
eukprot:2036792-Pleurochrysis_carterae.AAC.1